VESVESINMPVSPELAAAYALSARPYIEAGGPIPAAMLGTKSWRYLIELNSACNLRCALCTVGNREGYEYDHGNMLMDMGLLERVLDKIQSENPGAIVCPYGNGEPMLHPQLPECIAAIKRRGFRCEVATNLNLVNRLEDFLKAQPSFVIVSVSGFTQEVYGKSHRGGDIERVKENMHILKDAHNRWGGPVAIAVSYHMYNDNLDEMEPMKEFVAKLGFQFMISWARTISMENTVQSLRKIEGGVAPFPTKPGVLDLNTAFPGSKPEFEANMDRLRFHPKKARKLYERFPPSKVCLVGDVFTYIRHDGQVQLCAWCDDRRLSLGNYLEMSQDQISAARRGHPLCSECIRYRLNLYYHVVQANDWDNMNSKFNENH
jgi:MoaA/NifB/PqqE/SkfB family radical SAM enzyme